MADRLNKTRSDQSSESPSAPPGQPWRKPTGGAWLLIVLALVTLFGLVLVAGRVWQADSVGEDDAGVVHPQPMGVDDDASTRYD